MDSLPGTRGYFTYLATTEEIDTYNEVHKKLVQLNLESTLIDQQLINLVQECSERDDKEVLFLKTGIQPLMENQDRRKKMLRKMMVQLFESQCFDIGNLQGFILEQEVYNLMSTKSDITLKKMMRMIDKLLMISVDESNKEVSFLKMEFDRIPKKSNFARSNLGLSGDQAQSSQPQGFKNRSLSDLVVEMYGFSRDIALDIQECVGSRKLVSKPFKDVSMFDPLDFLDHQVLSENCEPEDAETLNWKSVGIFKENVEDLLNSEIWYEDEQNVMQILKALKDCVFHMESVICDLVYNIYGIMSDYEPAMIKFQDFNSVLKENKEQLDGMVPIIVYKILAMPKIADQGVESDKAVLYKEIEFDQTIKAFQVVIRNLGYVLRKTSGLLNASTMDKSVLASSQTLLHHSEKILKEIGLKIHGAKSSLEGLQVESITKKKRILSSKLTCPNSGIQKRRKQEEEPCDTSSN